MIKKLVSLLSWTTTVGIAVTLCSILPILFESSDYIIPFQIRIIFLHTGIYLWQLGYLCEVGYGFEGKVKKKNAIWYSPGAVILHTMIGTLSGPITAGFFLLYFADTTWLINHTTDWVLVICFTPLLLLLLSYLAGWSQRKSLVAIGRLKILGTIYYHVPQVSKIEQ